MEMKMIKWLQKQAEEKIKRLYIDKFYLVAQRNKLVIEGFDWTFKYTFKYSLIELDIAVSDLKIEVIKSLFGFRNGKESGDVEG